MSHLVILHDSNRLFSDCSRRVPRFRQVDSTTILMRLIIPMRMIKMMIKMMIMMMIMMMIIMMIMVMIKMMIKIMTIMMRS